MSSAPRTEPVAEFAGTRRFLVRRLLGEGSMGAVYLVFDRQSGREVALKLLRRVDASGIYRFKREFRALADMNHPNLVKLHELFCEDDGWFFTMEYVKGSSFIDFVLGQAGPAAQRSTAHSTPELELSASSDLSDAGGYQVHGLELLFPSPLRDEARLRDVLIQVAEGLSAVHASGKLHRDLKSENVLVTPEGRVVVLDFGIVTERKGQQYSTLELGVMGTPAYMSPEQAAGRALDEAADWYSFGVMLYEALTGNVPFDGTNLQVLQQKQHLDPLLPSQVVSGVPEDLSELCGQLLSRDPAARPGADAVLRALRNKRPASSPPPKPSIYAPPERPLVGRDVQLEQLDQALSSTDKGRPVLVFVSGDSGMGKTALVDAFLARARTEREAVVLKGACYERESLPFKAFDSLIDSLSRYLRRLPPVRAAELLPRDLYALVQLFPVLHRVEVIRDARRRTAVVADPQELRRRAFRALCELLGRIADQHPLVLFIDDIQWGDVDSAHLIAELTSSIDSPALCCVCAYRSGEVAGSPCLQTLFTHTREDAHADVRQVHVSALTTEQSYALARELLGQDAWQVSRVVGSEAQGSPFLLMELVRHVQGADSEQPPVVSLEQALAWRFGGLSDDARKLLALVAVAGRPLPEPMLSLAATFDIDVTTALAELRSARLLRGVAARALRAVDVYHDRIRQAVLARLAPEELVLWHRRLATTLEATGTMDLEALTEHLLGAGDVIRAGIYAKRAGAQAADALAFEKAARLYAVAARYDECSGSERAELLERWGDALVNAGRAQRGADVYFEACGVASAQHTLRLQRKAGVEWLRCGQFERGLQALGEVLQREDIALPATFAESFREARSLSLRLRERGLVFARRAEHEVPAAVIQRLDFLFSVTLGMLFTEVDRTLPLVVTCAIEALDAGEPLRVARALCLFHVYFDSSASSVLGQRSLGAIEVAAALATHSDDAQVRAWVAFARGSDAMHRGEVRSALRHLERAEEMFRSRCTGRAAEMRLCRQLMASLSAYDHDATELARCEEWAREAEEHGDLMGAARLRLLGTTLALMRDEVPRVLAYAAGSREWLRGEFDLTALLHQVMHSQVSLYGGDVRACRDAAEGFDGFFSSALAGVPLWRGQCLLQRALLRMQALGAGPGDADALRAIEHDVAAAERLSLSCLQPLAKLVRAGIEARRDQRVRALALLDEVAMLAQQPSDASLLAAVAVLCKGTLVGGVDGEQLAQRAEAELRSRGVRNPRLLGRLYAPQMH